MSNGCVVIASDIPNHRELIEDDKNGFLVDLKKPNILNLLNKINNDSKKYLKYSLMQLIVLIKKTV